ncbi:MAG: phosphonate ABC transporter, permease protein PhnE [Pseudobdellovibrionaceae bacterium]
MKLRPLIFDAIIFAFLFIVAAIVVVNPNEQQMLNLSWNAILFLIFAICGVAISLLLKQWGVRTCGRVLFASSHEKATAVDSAWYKTFWGWQLLLTLLVTFVVAINKTQFSFTELLDQDGFAGAQRLFHGIFNPNWAILPTAVLNIIETIFMAFLATTIAIPFAFILSFLCAKNIMKGPLAFSVYLFLRTSLNVTRSVEALIWAIIFSVWVGIGPFAGMLALMIHSIASLAKQYSEMVETVSEGPIEGILSTGANKLQTIWFAIVPQVILPYISFTVYRWDINVRMATIIGLVGGGGIGTMLIKYQGQAMWNEVGCIVVVIAVVVWLMDAASAYIREALK